MRYESYSEVMAAAREAFRNEKRDKKQYEEFKTKVQPKMVGFIDGMRALGSFNKVRISA